MINVKKSNTMSLGCDLDGVRLLCSLRFSHFHAPEAFECSLTQKKPDRHCTVCFAVGGGWIPSCDFPLKEPILSGVHALTHGLSF